MLFFVLNSFGHIFLTFLLLSYKQVHKLQLKPELMCKNAQKHIETLDFVSERNFLQIKSREISFNILTVKLSFKC